MPEAVIHTLSGHSGSVVACAVSPDSRLVASGSVDKTAKIWDAASGKEHATLRGHEGTVSDCAFSRAGDFLVTASGDRTLKIWDVSSWTVRKTFVGHADGVAGCAVSPDDTFVVSAGLDGALGIWDVATGKDRAILRGHTQEVMDCAISPDGSFIASASPDYSLRIWDVAAGAERAAYKGSLGVAKFYGCAISHDGRFVVGTTDTNIYAWDVASGQRRFKLGTNGIFLRCALSPDDKLLVTAGSLYNTLMIWDVAGQQKKARLVGGGPSPTVRDCAFSPDGRFIVSADDAVRTLRIWDVEKSLQLGAGLSIPCFIATAALGGDEAPEVVALRRFRDVVLHRTSTGRGFIAAYERLSPGVARLIARSPRARQITRALVVRPAARVARLFT